MEEAASYVIEGTLPRKNEPNLWMLWILIRQFANDTLFKCIQEGIFLMRKIIAITSVVVLIITGCGSQETDIKETEVSEVIETNSTKEISENTLTDNLEIKSTGAVTPADEQQEQKQNEDEIIDTKLYRVVIPNAWVENVDSITDSTIESGYALRFYDKASNETGYGGYLFGIEVFPENEDYSFYPEFEYLGIITDSSGNRFNIIVVEPSDVQFTNDTADIYKGLITYKQDVIDSLTPNDGVSFVKGAAMTETAVDFSNISNSSVLPYIDYTFPAVGESFTSLRRRSTLNFVELNENQLGGIAETYYIYQHDNTDVHFYVTNSNKFYAVKDDIVVAFSELHSENRFTREVLKSDCFHEVEPEPLYDYENCQAYGWSGNNGIMVVSVIGISGTNFMDCGIRSVTFYVNSSYCSLNTGDNY